MPDEGSLYAAAVLIALLLTAGLTWTETAVASAPSHDGAGDADLLHAIYLPIMETAGGRSDDGTGGDGPEATPTAPSASTATRVPPTATSAPPTTTPSPSVTQTRPPSPTPRGYPGP